MNNTKLIDSCQAHLPVQYASNIELIRQKWYGVVIDSKPHLNRTCKTILLLAPLAVYYIKAGCSAFLFYTPTNLFIF